VYLYFPISGGWRTQELTASAKYLSPVAQQCFIPAAGVGQAAWAARPLPMLAHAAVYADDETHWVPAQNKFIELPLSPRTPAAAG
jgi:hypothetical protein